MEKKDKEVKPEAIKATPVTGAKPKKRHGCLIAAIIIGGLFVLIFIASQILPFIGLLFYKPESNTPDIPLETKTETPAETPKQTPAPTSKKSTDSTTNTSANTKEEYINYFTQTATNSGRETLGRFSKSPVYLKISGTMPAGAEDTINTVIADFNALSESIKIERNDAGSDIQMFFMPFAELDNYRQPSPKEAFEVDVPNADCSYKYAKVYVSNDVLDSQNMTSVLRHELAHAFGFKGHISPTTVNSIMANRILTAHFTDLDQVLIQMLYNMGVPLCADSASISSFFAGWNP